MIKAIIFDMDGVLTKSIENHIESWKFAFNKFKIFPKNKDLALLEGMSYKETIEHILKKYKQQLNENEKERLYLTKKEKLNEIFELSIYLEIPGLLNLLKENNIKMAVVTGANKEFTQKIINKFFANIFEIIITGDDVKKGKPNPEPYLKAIKKLNFKAEEIIVIENAPLGIQSAKKSKLKTFALETTLNRKYLNQADKIFSTHIELIKFIQKELKKD